MIKIILSPQAKADNQAGSGKVAHRKRLNLSRAIRVRLQEEFAVHKEDRFVSGNQQLLVEVFANSYQVFQSAAGNIYIQVDRVFGSGQDRAAANVIEELAV